MNARTVAAALVTVVFAGAVTWGPGLYGRYQKGQPLDISIDEEEDEDEEEEVDEQEEDEEGASPDAVDPPPPSPPVPARPLAAGRLPNVVLVFGCTLRKDQTALYGGPDTMPWLRRLAEAGTTFDDALSVSSWTRASAVGVLTSRHPLSLGLPEPGPRQSQRVLTDEVTLLAEFLGAAGLETFGITGNPNLNRQYGMAQGMDVYHDSNPKAFRQGRIEGTVQVQTALASLDARTDPARPFYLQLMLIDAHHPRQPDPTVVQRYRRAGASPTMATYQASLTQLDDAFDQLDRGLASRGYDARNTLFVFVADHGEGLNEPAHHGGGHGKKMYPTTVAIPWVVRGPGVEAGGRIAGLASGVDVLPTIAGLLDLMPPEPIVGHDLSAWVRGERDDRLPRERAFAYSMFHRADVGSIWTRTSQCQDHFEHDLDGVVTGCFDRSADPTFADPIALPDLHAELVAWRQAQLAIAAGKDVTTTEVDADVAEQLRLLGYAED